MTDKIRSKREKPEWARVCEHLRKDLGISQEDLAFKANLSQATISQIERGAQEPLDLSARRLGQYLNALQLTLQEFEEKTGLKSELPIKPVGGIGITDAQFVQVNLHTTSNPDQPALTTTDIPAHLHKGKTTRAYLVDTDSMTGNAEDAITPQSIIYVDTAETQPQEGHKYLIKTDGQTHIGLARTIKGDTIFTFYNPNHLPIRSAESTILGRVYYSIKPHKH